MGVHCALWVLLSQLAFSTDVSFNGRGRALTGFLCLRSVPAAKMILGGGRYNLALLYAPNLAGLRLCK
jgi:hypothetical protein